MLSLLGREAFSCMVVEEEGVTSRILGASVSTFVQESFFCEMKTPPSFWGTPEIVRRELNGQSVILSNDELRRDNIGSGLNLFVWHLGISEDERRLEVGSTMLDSFVKAHGGYNLKEFMGQADTWGHFAAMRQAGGCFIRPTGGEYADSLESIDVDVTQTPVNVGISREMARGTAIGSWCSALFDYSSPRLGLSRSQQRLLSAALNGHTDEELSKHLDISLFTVKKVWLEIDRRAALNLPEVFADLRHDGQTQWRGKQKRHRLLSYLQEHPEELRPALRQRNGTIVGKQSIG
jgi:DNA-binding CsgD family transcriptional regulator